MNREVKFRGQDYTTGEWVYGYYFENPMRYGTYSMIIPIDCEGCNEDDLIKPIHVKRETIGEFTGLKDKNGVEIYEGDILQEMGNNFQILFGEYETDQATCIGFYYNDGHPFGRPYSNSEIGEIIGNVHENPELLNS